jgi:hypothetical protein
MFFSGEEFNASFRPLTWVSPHLYGGKDAGKGRWLYGAMLDWADLDQPEHRAMFEDVKKMIAVRRREAEVVAVTLEQIKPNLLAVPCEHDIAVPVPYVRWNRQAAIIIAANRSTTQDARLKLLIPLTEIGSAGHASYRVSNLWPGGESKLCGEAELRAYDCTVKRDRMAGGGLLVLKIEPV